MKTLRLATIAVLASLLAGCYTVSDGQRAGTVIKLSHKGFLVNTWEGQLLLGGAGNNATVWEFTVEDDKLIPALKAAMDSGKPVNLSYRQEWIVAPWRGDTDYFVTGVK